jgi:chorismate-pyruvate lyase
MPITQATPSSLIEPPAKQASIAGARPLMGLFRPSDEDPWRLSAFSMFPQLPAILRLLLSTDGTVTKSMESYFWEPVSVDVHFHGNCRVEQPLPTLDLSAGDTVLKRNVVLRMIRQNRPMVFAESLVRVDRLWESVQEDLIQGRLGIGEVLNNRRTAQYRHIFNIWRESAGPLAPVLHVTPECELICRSYSITTDDTTIMMITEKFILNHFIG